jgi:flavodoxin
MKTLVIYDSQFGNTERIAKVIAHQLGANAPLFAADGAAKEALRQDNWELLVIGAPTQRHAASPTMRALLESLPRGALKDKRAAVFDTRYRMARFLTGSAAGWIAARLRRAGATLAAAPESFFVEQDTPPPGEKRRHDHEQLEAGEEDRALIWAGSMVANGPAAASR